GRGGDLGKDPGVRVGGRYLDVEVEDDAQAILDDQHDEHRHAYVPEPGPAQPSPPLGSRVSCISHLRPASPTLPSTNNGPAASPVHRGAAVLAVRSMSLKPAPVLPGRINPRRSLLAELTRDGPSWPN